MPEGDSLHRAARRLQALVGERVEAEAPHPRGAATGVAERVDGRRVLGIEPRGKNLLIRFEGGHVLRSHLRMSGRWRIQPVSALRHANSRPRPGGRQPYGLLVPGVPRA